jgi:hypothetical protein
MPWRRYGCASERATVADVEGAARRLLRALNENQAHDREGAEVKPGEQEAHDAGLRPGSHLHRAAVWWLLDTGALAPEWDANVRARNASGAQHRDFAFKITRGGLDMLRRT